jgi:histidinol phosphatase-like PHP family hydrolase
MEAIRSRRWQKRRKRGYEYFGVADHSQSARYAGGLSVEQIRQQHAEIDRLNARFDGRFRIFKGIDVADPFVPILGPHDGPATAAPVRL